MANGTVLGLYFLGISAGIAFAKFSKEDTSTTVGLVLGVLGLVVFYFG
ncbi:MAG: hypothetical protein ACRCX2_30615 [Paraclostridium sp.]